ncbi:FHA domain-containing serine/threonine-protein kinase [Candidatus Uabimicrobium amorphum]|uniref:Protein kinase n=1 Tax=Uabimicrobium amorphum TaxID=2596890 RepID=A0A5S9IIX2_UABAM|nr:FHA domain-containing serine/threonine-protein kinase [Candidatus Uabimicrobium amorphum]BBM82222.1 protein kinase [Candidatus Uabimicrobium amorphum]
MDDLSLKELKFQSQTTYTIIEEIGRGGLGIIYLAARNSGGVTDYVVLKALQPLSSEDEQILREETNLAATLHHENIVKTYGLESITLSQLPASFSENIKNLSYRRVVEKQEHEFRRLNFREEDHSGGNHVECGTGSDKILLIAMDFVDGLNLEELHQQHLNMSILIPEKFGAFIISRIARALGYAHNYMIHKDISPKNILVNTHGICKLGDFGVEAIAHKQEDYLEGKLSYLPPEKYLKTFVDERTDLFALGLVAYEILTGISLFHTSNNLPKEQRIEEIKQRIAKGILPPSKVRKDIPEELSQIVVKMLNPSSVLRYQRSITVANHLEKKYLYNKGYGPTNNSLANYLHIFESKFSLYTEDQLQNLSFLKNANDEIQLRRKLDEESYTKEGLELMKQIDYALYQKVIDGGGVIVNKFHCIKLKHLDNVIESFSIENNDLSIGNGPQASISLIEENILEQHAKIERKDNDIKIVSLDESNKVIVNDQEVSTKDLQEGDKIEIGSHELFFLNQVNIDEQQPQQVFTVTGDMDISQVENVSNFALKIPIDNLSFAASARIIQSMLDKTNLSVLKKGVIPTAFMETLQLLKGESDSLNVHIIKDAVRILFRCSGFDEQGYHNLLSTFNKHRADLMKQIQESKVEKSFGMTSTELDLFSSQEDMKSSDAVDEDLLESEEESEDSSDASDIDDDDDSDFDSDIDIDLDALEDGTAFENVAILAAIMIIHSFDRIEFKKYMKEIELVVNYS